MNIRKPRRQRLRVALVAALLSTTVACESVEPYITDLILVGGTVIEVAALTYQGGTYAPEVTLLMATLTPAAMSVASTWVANRQEERELAAIEEEIAKEYEALDAPYQLPSQGPAAGAWGAPPVGGDTWGTAYGEQGAGTGWTNAAQQQGAGGPGAAALAAGGGASASPWGDRYSKRGVEPRGEGGQINLDVALLRKAGSAAVVIQNGEVLQDAEGRSGVVGDQLRAYFSPTEPLYVYVVAVDAAAQVQPLFPPQLPPPGPVAAGAQVLLPGPDGWFGLDGFRGIQHVYFYASRERNFELEAQLHHFAAGAPPTPGAQRYRVSEPTIIEDQGDVAARGLTGVSSTPQSVTLEQGSLEIEATRVSGADGELVATRYFDHR